MKLFGLRIAKTSTLEMETYRAVEALKYATYEESRKAFIAEGYTEWVHTSPPSNRQFLLIRSGWYWPQLTSVAETSPYMNICGAFWKLNDDSPIHPIPKTLSTYVQ